MIFQGWKENIKDFFTKKNLMLFAFGLFQMIKRSIPTFAAYFGWLILLEIFLKTYISLIPINTLFKGNHFGTALFLGTAFLSSLSLVIMAMLVRPSLGLKNFKYFVKSFFNTPGLFWVLLGVLFPLQLLNLFIFISKNTGTLSFVGNTFYYPAVDFLLLARVPFAIFFLCDIQNKQKNFTSSFSNSSKGILFSLPAFLFLLGLYILVTYSLTFLAPSFLTTLITYVTNFIFIAAMSMTYMKIKHGSLRRFIISQS